MQRASPSDLEQVDALLRGEGLPSLPGEPAKVELWVCREGERVVGAIGLETAGGDALLRSAVVATSHRGRGLGRTLVHALLDTARERGLRAIYLLTETAEPFFARQGFARVSREAAPTSIRATDEFRSQCPDSAALMCHALSGSGEPAG